MQRGLGGGGGGGQVRLSARCWEQWGGGAGAMHQCVRVRCAATPLLLLECWQPLQSIMILVIIPKSVNKKSRFTRLQSSNTPKVIMSHIYRKPVTIDCFTGGGGLGQKLEPQISSDCRFDLEGQSPGPPNVLNLFAMSAAVRMPSCASPHSSPPPCSRPNWCLRLNRFCMQHNLKIEQA